MSEIDIRGDDALVALLLHAEKDDIDPLLDYITTDGKFDFSQSESVKAVLQDTKKSDTVDEDTLRLLVRELQHFGGNTFANLLRRNGARYSDIVNDVASHLKIKASETSSLEEKEALIVDAVFTSSWSTMSDEVRRQVLNDTGIYTNVSLDKLSQMDIPALQKAAVVASGLAQVAGGGALRLVAGLGLGRVLGFVTGPVGLALTSLYTAYDISNPAFRVTLPCVVQIAWIRLKKSRNLRLSESQPSVMTTIQNYDRRWVFENEERLPVLTVSSLAISAVKNVETLPQHDVTGISPLSPLLQTLPSLVTSVHLANHHYMEVVIEGALASVKGGAGYRGFSMGANGIKEHAVLLSPDNLHRLVNASLLLNVASAVLAQKHLADISHKLMQISETIREVSIFQNTARHSEIISFIEYLKQITPVVRARQSSVDYRQGLEDIEKRSISVQDHLRKDIVAIGEKVYSLKDNAFFGSADITSKILEQQKILDERIVEWDLTMKVRGQALHLLSHIGVESMLVQRRHQSIDDHYADFNRAIERVEQQMHQRIDGISAITEQTNTTLANKVLLRKWANSHLKQHIASIEVAHKAIGKIQKNMLDTPSSPTRMLVEMRNGEVVKCFSLPDC